MQTSKNNLEKTNTRKEDNNINSTKASQRTVFSKKRKNNTKLCEKIGIYDDISDFSIPEINNQLIETAYKTNLITYIKTLLEAYKSIPNIIGIIDRIVENKASTISTTNIYGNSYLATYKDIDKIINMSQRKDKLLNLFVITDKMLDSLCDKDRKVAVLKFVQKNSAEEIAKEIGVSDRTIYRRATRVIEKLAIYCLNENWTSSFIKSQIGEEPWLEDIFNKKKEEEYLLNIKK